MLSGQFCCCALSDHSWTLGLYHAMPIRQRTLTLAVRGTSHEPLRHGTGHGAAAERRAPPTWEARKTMTRESRKACAHAYLDQSPRSDNLTPSSYRRDARHLHVFCVLPCSSASAGGSGGAGALMRFLVAPHACAAEPSAVTSLPINSHIRHKR